MKTKITGLVLIVMAVAIPVAIFILPEYIRTTGIWQTIFDISFYSGAGLAIGINISLFRRLTVKLSMICSFAGLFVGFLTGLFCLIAPITFWVVSISLITLAALIASAILFLIKAAEFMFFLN